MTILITGGGGFLGNRLARELARRKTLRLGGVDKPITKIVLADLGFAPETLAGLDPMISTVTGDVGAPELLRSLVTRDVAVVYHLAAMVSGEGERNFDGCLHANLDGTRHVLEASRAAGHVPRVVFASSLAAFGGPYLPQIVSDTVKNLPQTTYGMTKLIGELLVADYTRKGFIDGRAARLPTIFIRPGKANAAASSFASAVFREPIAGRAYDLPVSRDVVVALLGYRMLVANLITLAEVDSAAIGVDRAITLPSNQYRVRDMVTTLERVAKERGRKLGPIIDKPDPVIVKIVDGWPVGTEHARAEKLGLKTDVSLERVIVDYFEDYA